MSARDDVLAAVRGALGPGVTVTRPRTARHRVHRRHVRRPTCQGRARGDARPVRRAGRRLPGHRERCAADELATTDRRGAATVRRRSVVPPGLEIDVPGAVARRRPDRARPRRARRGGHRRRRRHRRDRHHRARPRPRPGPRAISSCPTCTSASSARDQVVPDVPDAVARLDPRRPHTWISGPSATSDIELNRVEGVHGPRRLHVRPGRATSGSDPPVGRDRALSGGGGSREEGWRAALVAGGWPHAFW